MARHQQGEGAVLQSDACLHFIRSVQSLPAGQGVRVQIID